MAIRQVIFCRHLIEPSPIQKERQSKKHAHRTIKYSKHVDDVDKQSKYDYLEKAQKFI